MLAKPEKMYQMNTNGPKIFLNNNIGPWPFSSGLPTLSFSSGKFPIPVSFSALNRG
jgi:hypothetical protein